MAESKVNPAHGRNVAVNMLPSNRKNEQEQAPITMRNKI